MLVIGKYTEVFRGDLFLVGGGSLRGGRGEDYMGESFHGQIFPGGRIFSMKRAGILRIV